MEVGYVKTDAVMMPDLETLSEPSPTGVFALMRLEFLAKSRPVLYVNLLTSGRLSGHLAEIQRLAEELVERTAPDMARAEGATDELKTADPLAWAGLMSAARASATEVARKELVEA